MSRKVRVAQLSVASNLFLIAFKLLVGILIGSVGIISEALHSGMDLAAALIALFAVRLSGKPPDERHQYGHGKIENISGVIEALLIFAAALWIIAEAVRRIVTGGRVEEPFWGIVVMAVSGGVNLVVSNILLKVARETDSVALEADAWHLRTDVYTSLGVGGGLFLLWLTGLQILDPLAALGVALLIIKAAWDLVCKAFSPLLDTRLPEEEVDAIKEIIAAYDAHYVGYHKLRTRKAGSERHIDLHLVVPPRENIAKVHELCDKIEAALGRRFGNAHVLIHVEPCRAGEECLRCTANCDQAKKEVEE